jgi:hypothetical protein
LLVRHTRDCAKTFCYEKGEQQKASVVHGEVESLLDERCGYAGIGLDSRDLRLLPIIRHYPEIKTKIHAAENSILKAGTAMQTDVQAL